MNLYRVHYAWTRGGASSNEIVFYEDADRLKVDLLEHHLDIMYNDSRRNWLRLRLSSLWSKRADGERRTTKIFKVERALNDEWVPLEYSFIEPDVIIND